eukprot:NODE_12778_length_1204_cov_13.564531.p1 GENE.NODE_12778_length_1204_cov_13.564531~~NODE_12778_length_1204_cov_13.564531.p1  ORF type:complete len:212 (+),score=47.81 NODE_12778_length_1204_cov_13.564531:103-738(+)
MSQQKLLEDPTVKGAVMKAGADARNDSAGQVGIMKQYQTKSLAAAAGAADKIADLAQGPDAVRFLSFIGGAVSCVLAGYHLVDVFGIMTETAQYVMYIFLMVFSLTVVIIEGKVEWVEKIAFLLKYEEMLIEKAKFLTEPIGRGLFYIFFGSLWLSFPYLGSIIDLIQLGLSGYMILIGVVHVFMQFGVHPHEVVKKVRASRRANYQDQVP